MSIQKGSSSKLYEMIRTRMNAGEIISTDQAHKMLRDWRADITRQAAANALSYLKRAGKLNPAGLAGNYTVLANGAEDQGDVEIVVIENLLSAMAAAEPVLHRCKKLLAALKAVD